MLKSILIYSFLLSSSSSYLCPDPETFTRHNAMFFSQATISLQRASGKYLHRFLLDLGTELGRGSFGVVKDVPGSLQPMVIKEIVPKSDDQRASIAKEIAILKFICGKDHELIYPQLFECEAPEIAGFRGCVKEGDQAFIFQSRAFGDFSNAEIRATYQGLPPFRRAMVMMNIIDKFVMLHRRGIIHSDVKPANIMATDSSISNQVIVDLGVAAASGTPLISGTWIFLPPEWSFGASLLSPRNDIYALGLTFAFLEGPMEIYMNSLDPNCIFRRMTPYCFETVRFGVKQIFHQDRGLSELTEVILKAISFHPSQSHAEMTDFSREFVEAVRKIPESRINFAKILSKPTLTDSSGRKMSEPHWIKFARENNFHEEPENFWTWLGGLLACGQKPHRARREDEETEINVDVEKARESLGFSSDNILRNRRVLTNSENKPASSDEESQWVIQPSPDYLNDHQEEGKPANVPKKDKVKILV